MDLPEISCEVNMTESFSVPAGAQRRRRQRSRSRKLVAVSGTIAVVSSKAGKNSSAERS